MKLVVCLKQVPDTETKIRIKPSQDAIETEGVNYCINPYDEYAIEEALKIKERLGNGEVTLLTVGEDKATEALRTGLAMGADRAFLLKDPCFSGSDALATALILCSALRKIGFDLILCGKQAIDKDNHQVGPQLAELLDIPHAAVIVKLEVDAQGMKAVAHRQIEGGSEVLEFPLPALVTCQKGLNEPRYASLKGIMTAKKKPLEVWGCHDLEIEGDLVGEKGSRTHILSMSPPPERTAGKVLEGEPNEVARKVINLLRDEAKVL